MSSVDNPATPVELNDAISSVEKVARSSVVNAAICSEVRALTWADVKASACSVVKAAMTLVLNPETAPEPEPQAVSRRAERPLRAERGNTDGGERP